jgi:hypothetical protein
MEVHQRILQHYQTLVANGQYCIPWGSKVGSVRTLDLARFDYNLSLGLAEGCTNVLVSLLLKLHDLLAIVITLDETLASLLHNKTSLLVYQGMR